MMPSWPYGECVIASPLGTVRLDRPGTVGQSVQIGQPAQAWPETADYSNQDRMDPELPFALHL